MNSEPDSNDIPIDLKNNCILLNGLAESSLVDFWKFVSLQSYASNEIIEAEGETASKFYIILKGSVEILKKDQSTGNEFQISTLETYNYFGEGALIGQGFRNATVKTLSDSEILVLDANAIIQQEKKPDWFHHFIFNIAQQGNIRLSKTNEITAASLTRDLENAKQRLAMNHFLIAIIICFSLYSVGISFTLRLSHSFLLENLISNGLMVLFGVAVFIFMKKSPYSVEFFGLRLSPKWRKEILESVTISLVFIALLTWIKYLLVTYIPQYNDMPVFQSSWLTFQPTTAELIFALIYIPLTPVQELIVRGGMQNPLANFFSETKHPTFYAIVLSNAMFAAGHAHLSPAFAIAVFVPGIIWGIIFARYQSLLGVSISHIIIGLWAVQILGMNHFLGVSF